MKNSVLILGSLLAIISCENKKTETVTAPKQDSLAASTEISSDIVPIDTHCFLGTIEKDSVLLSYEDNLGTITGKLKYKNHEKDSSKGDISGLMSGDTLKVSYTFASEGATSDREIWFLKKGKTIIEAVGKYDDSGLKYANTKNITFTGTELNSVGCENISRELK